MLEAKCVMQCGANSRGRVVLLWRPGSGRGRGSLERTSKGAKGRVAYRQRIASLARGARGAIPSDTPSRRWRLGRLGERTSAIAGRAGLRPFGVCPVFRGWEAGATSALAEQHLCCCLRAASFINAACSSSRTFLLHYCIHQTNSLHPNHTNSNHNTPTNTTTTTATMPFTGS